MKQRLINHIESIQDPALRKTCESILTIEKFFTWPASLSFHHAYEGGLLAHTVEVCDIALQTVRGNTVGGWSLSFNVECNLDILIAAALWHDVMKVEEYIVTDRRACETTITRHVPFSLHDSWIKDYSRVKMFGDHEHIIAGASFFQKSARFNNVHVETIDAITHCILAHHGRKEWGSPVEPQTLEALILHQSDMLSAHYGATK